MPGVSVPRARGLPSLTTSLAPLRSSYALRSDPDCGFFVCLTPRRRQSEKTRSRRQHKPHDSFTLDLRALDQLRVRP
jgi:hypothetical protein